MAEEQPPEGVPETIVEEPGAEEAQAQADAAEAAGEGAPEAAPEEGAPAEEAPQEGGEQPPEEEKAAEEQPPAGEEQAAEQQPVDQAAEAAPEAVAEEQGGQPESEEKPAEGEEGVSEIAEQENVADVSAAPGDKQASGDLSKVPARSSSVKSYDLRLSITGSEMSRSSKVVIDKAKQRVPSKGKALGSIISIRRGSFGDGGPGGARAAKFMNSYKLDSDKPFHIEKVEKILEEVMTEALENLTYDPEKCPQQAKWATSTIRNKIKEQEFDRYKIVTIVTIGEKRSQDVFTSMKFLWDSERDKYATFCLENMSVFAYACCFGLYYE